MPKPRRQNQKGLPARWLSQHGAYYYRVPKGLESAWDGKQLFRLGTTLSQAYRAWASRTEACEQICTIGALFDRYLLSVVPELELPTQEGYRIFIKRLRTVFGEMPLTAIKPQTIYQYVDKRQAKSAAAHEVQVFSAVFSKAVEWGYIDQHPFKGQVRIKSGKPNTRYVEDWEIVECLSLDCKRKKGSVLTIQAYIRLKLMTGMGRGDLLRLTMSDLKEDGIHIQRHKTAKTTGKRTIYQWTPELREAVDMALASRPALSPFLFCNKFGKGYVDESKGTAAGFKSMWQRFFERVIAETKVTEHFTEHDLRAKCASDALTLEHARALLSHADSRTTERVYRRAPEKVMPLRGVLD
jgi:integrase